MKGKAEVIRHLNIVLSNELVAISQYFLHARMFQDWGYGSLGKHVMGESVDEMKHADELIKRILFLESVPEMSAGKPQVGSNVKEALTKDLELELKAHPCLVAGIQKCEELGDFVSRELFQKIVDAEEEHIDWLETQLGLMEQVGMENYLQTQMDEGQ